MKYFNMSFSNYILMLVLCKFGIFCCATAIYREESLLRNNVSTKVYRIIPKSRDEIRFLKLIQLNPVFDFWLEPTAINEPVDIMVEGKVQTLLKRKLSKKNIEFTIFMDDVDLEIKKNILENKVALKLATNLNFYRNHFTWTAYHSYTDIVEWLEYLQTTHPRRITLIPVGRSYEYRRMYVAKLSQKDTHKIKPAIWIEGGMHGREWISPAVVTYILNELLHNKIYYDILEKVDFYFMPVLNPDGYAYTFTEGGRLWKKTRSKTNSLLNCIGADPNRNWNFHWNEDHRNFSCSDNYPGDFAFSEKEVKMIKNEIILNILHMKGYLSYHSYAQLWLFPWGYTTKQVSDSAELEALSSAAVEAIYSYNGTRYKQMPKCTITEFCVYGNSIDWMRGVSQIKYPFEIQLPDMGNYGYLLPPTKIIPTGEESLRGVIVIANTIAHENKIIQN